MVIIETMWKPPGMPWPWCAHAALHVRLSLMTKKHSMGLHRTWTTPSSFENPTVFDASALPRSYHPIVLP